MAITILLIAYFIIKMIVVIGLISWGIIKTKNANDGQCPERFAEDIVEELSQETKDNLKDEIDDNKILQWYVDKKLEYNKFRMKILIKITEIITRCEVW